MLKKLHEASATATGFNDILSYNWFRVSWYSNIRLLDIDYKSGFTCQKCGECPKIIIMDGTSIAFRKELDTWNSILFDINPPKKQRKAGR